MTTSILPLLPGDDKACRGLILAKYRRLNEVIRSTRKPAWTLEAVAVYVDSGDLEDSYLDIYRLATVWLSREHQAA
jgi:hypothetical protein